MKLVIGLGNPGTKYEKTWHNAGFWLVDYLASKSGATWESSKFDGEFAKGNIEGTPVVFVKPLTFMNLSGKSVAKFAQFFKIEASQWIVLHDDIDLPIRAVKARIGGGHGGHNGLRSIMDVTGRADFSRIKLGVGRPGLNENGSPETEVSSYVLRSLDNSIVEGFLKAVVPEAKLSLKDLIKR